MKETVLTQLHISLGAKMAEFAGFNMPIVYSSINEEHKAVRNSVGVFDVSHMGEFMLKGEKALDLIQLITTNDASKLTDGKIQYTCLPNDKGGIVDDLLVYRFNATEYYLVVNAGNIEKDWNWIKQHNTFGVEMTDMSSDLSLFAVQGPNAIKTLQKLTDINLSEIPYYAFAAGKLAGIDDVIISNTGYTGAGGFEIYVWNKDARKMWDAVFEAGKEFGIVPTGLGCRDTLRLEKAFCLYGHDIDDTTSPIEAGLGWITKFTKNFIMAAHHKAIKDNGPQKKLVGFEIPEKGKIPRQHFKIKDAAGNEIGEVTSGTQSPTLGKAIGLGYVKTEHSAGGSEIFVEIRNALVKAVVVKTPFV